MTATEDLFTPIHKALRSMIYNLGGRLQANDFADLAASKALLADLEHDFAVALSAGCILCAIHHHASVENTMIFPGISAIDASVVRRFIEEHHQFARRIQAITKMARAIPSEAAPDERVHLGVSLNRTVNEFFAAYLDHLNREEKELVPFMRTHFTDEQMRALRATMFGETPNEGVRSMLGWMLPALSARELEAMLSDLKHRSSPALFRFMVEVAASKVPADRWNSVRQRAGL